MKFFKTKLNVENHVSKVHERKNPEILPRPHPFSCFVCSKVLQSQDDVKMHISTVHLFRCDICLKVFQSEADVKIHNSTDHGIKESNKQVHEEKQPFQCPFCTIKFDHKVEFNIHLSRVHEEKGILLVEELQCSYCPSKFSDKDEIKRHFLKVHDRKGHDVAMKI